jgi:hypothetical protein
VQRALHGEAVVRILPQPEDNAAFLVGVVLVEAPPASVVEAVRSLAVVQSCPRILQWGRFSRPPAKQDMAALTFEPQDLRDLRRCRVGDCDIRVDGRTLAAARRLDWSAPDASLQGTLILKQALVDLLHAYAERGPAGMAVYLESDTPDDSGHEATRLLRDPPSPLPESPSLMRYLREYPKGRAADVEDSFIWSKEALRRPVVSLVHVSLQTQAGDGPGRVVLALQHVYDSHYFLAYAEFISLVPATGAAGGFYLVREIRSRIDPPHWFRGLLLGKIKRRMREALRTDLEATRRQILAAQRPSGAGSDGATR